MTVVADWLIVAFVGAVTALSVLVNWHLRQHDRELRALRDHVHALRLELWDVEARVTALEGHREPRSIAGEAEPDVRWILDERRRD